MNKKIEWDYSRFGISDGVVAFVVSTIKTGLAAFLVAVGAMLANYSITGDSQHVMILTGVVAVLRGVISGGLNWLKASNPTVNSDQPVG